MENLNSTVNEATPVAESVEALPVPGMDLASSVTGTDTPKASPSTGDLGAGASVPVETVAPAVIAKPAPVVIPSGQIIKGELPKTTGTTPGGWNRFAGYDPKASKDKKNDRRDGKGRK